MKRFIFSVFVIFFSVFAFANEALLAKLPSGYLLKEQLPDSLQLLPPAPKSTSPRQILDDAIANKAIKLYKTPRFIVATKDADLHFPAAPNRFACALGKEISKEKTPRLLMLLLRAAVDAGYATQKAKLTYKRPRPFTKNNAPICTPEIADKLKEDGSYPSGHSALGWTWALILAELSPSHANAILQRGKAFGESRIVCNVHWYSDVLAGRAIGSSVFALLHTSPEFLADLKAAKKELLGATKPEETICQEERKYLSFDLE